MGEGSKGSIDVREGRVMKEVGGRKKTGEEGAPQGGVVTQSCDLTVSNLLWLS